MRTVKISKRLLAKYMGALPTISGGDYPLYINPSSVELGRIASSGEGNSIRYIIHFPTKRMFVWNGRHQAHRPVENMLLRKSIIPEKPSITNTRGLAIYPTCMVGMGSIKEDKIHINYYDDKYLTDSGRQSILDTNTAWLRKLVSNWNEILKTVKGNMSYASQ